MFGQGVLALAMEPNAADHVGSWLIGIGKYLWVHSFLWHSEYLPSWGQAGEGRSVIAQKTVISSSFGIEKRVANVIEHHAVSQQPGSW